MENEKLGSGQSGALWRNTLNYLVLFVVGRRVSVGDNQSNLSGSNPRLKPSGSIPPDFISPPLPLYILTTKRICASKKGCGVMDYSNYPDNQSQPFSLYGLPTPDQQPQPPSDNGLRDPFSLVRYIPPYALFSIDSVL